MGEPSFKKHPAEKEGESDIIQATKGRVTIQKGGKEKMHRAEASCPLKKRDKKTKNKGQFCYKPEKKCKAEYTNEPGTRERAIFYSERKGESRGREVTNKKRGDQGRSLIT